MGRLAELMGVGPKPVAARTDTEMNSWGGMPYAQLSVILVNLRYLGMLHQTHHWISKGDPFYGDHKLYEQLYKTIVEEVDDVAEKAVGMGGEQNVCLGTQIEEMLRVSTMMGDKEDGVPTPEMLAKKSLLAEVAFIKCVTEMLQSMHDQGVRTDGISNMLQGICDVHERHVYLLKRRSMAATSGMR
jgi:DNA-binding ferritin-like protein